MGAAYHAARDVALTANQTLDNPLVGRVRVCLVSQGFVDKGKALEMVNRDATRYCRHKVFPIMVGNRNPTRQNHVATVRAFNHGIFQRIYRQGERDDRILVGRKPSERGGRQRRYYRALSHQSAGEGGHLFEWTRFIHAQRRRKFLIHTPYKRNQLGQIHVASIYTDRVVKLVYVVAQIQGVQEWLAAEKNVEFTRHRSPRPAAVLPRLPREI